MTGRPGWVHHPRHKHAESRIVTDGGYERERAGERVPEWIGTVLFFLAVALTAAKLNDDFGEHGIWGYATLILMITLFAAAVGAAYV